MYCETINSVIEVEEFNNTKISFAYCSHRVCFHFTAHIYIYIIWPQVISFWEYDLKVITLSEYDLKVISFWEYDLKVISLLEYDLKVIFANAGPTDGPTDRRTDRHTKPHIEMRGRI